MGKRKAENDEWDVFKDEILKLYATRTLTEVMRIMDGRGFKRTKSQYERHLKKWKAETSAGASDGVRINVTASEWAYINEQLAERQLRGKESEVYKRGFRIPQSRIEKQGRVHSHQTTLARFAPKVHVVEPNDIRVSTPPPRQAPASALRHNIPTANLFDFRYSPWQRFVRTFNNFVRVMINYNQTPKPLAQPFNIAIRTAPKSSPAIYASQITNISDPVTGTGTLWYGVSRFQELLPELIPEFQDGDASSIAIKGTQLELLKNLVGLISNGHVGFGISETILNLAQDRRNLKYLRRFLTSRDLTIRAFREKLLFISFSSPASDYAPNLTLMRVVLDSGADVDANDIKGYSLIAKAINNAAVGTRYHTLHKNKWIPEYLEIVLDLIGRGARWPTTRFGELSALEVLIDCADQKTIYKILEGIPETHRNCLEITVKTYIRTAHQGNIHLFQQLISFAPAILARLKARPWLLFEAAAFGHNSISMIKYLRKIEFDIMAVDGARRGNPLVFAPFSSKPGVFQYLVHIGLSIDRPANGEMLLSLDRNVHWSEDMKTLIYDNKGGLAPIHAATMYGDQHMVNQLLALGVNPNQHGVALPIQLAAAREDFNGLNMIRTLLAASPLADFTADNQLEHVNRPKGLQRLYATALLAAVKLGNLEGFKILYEFGAEFSEPPRCSCGRYSDSIYLANSTSGEDYMEHIRSHAALLYHCGYTQETCLYHQEVTWNPLLLASESRSKELVLYLLKVSTLRLMVLWATQECFSSFTRNFEWNFVSQLLQDGTFELSYLNREEIALRAIREKDEYWTYRMMNDHHMRGDSTLRMFVAAVYTNWSTVIQTFLDKGYWPDDEIYMCLQIDHQSKIERHFTPLGEAQMRKHKTIRDLFLRHYSISSEGNLNSVEHLGKAHVISLCHGDFKFAKRINPHGNIDDIYPYVSKHYREQLCGRYKNYPCSEKLVTSVQLAVAFDQITTAQQLLDEGADPNISYDTRDKASAYHSPLQMVVKRGYSSCLVTTLIEKGADVNHKPIDIRGATALQFAAMNGNISTLRILLEAGAHIDAPPCKWEGRTAIEGAAEFGRLDTVSLLLEAGADMQGNTNVNYRRTVYRATVHGHHVLAELIQSWKTERYGAKDCESTETIVRSMDLETLGYTGREHLKVADPSHRYLDPCRACVKGCARMLSGRAKF